MVRDDIQVISGATVLAGPRLDRVDDALVVIENETIRAAGPASDVELPQDAVVIDATSKTLLPGFIDAHVHIGFHDPVEVVAGGVTTVRDLGWPPDEIARLVAASLADDWDGPSIIAAGPMLTAPGGYPVHAAWAPDGTAAEVRDEHEGRAVVDAIADAEFAIVKVALNPPAGPVLDRATLSAIVGRAHERGLKVTGHIYGLDELHKAITAGIDELAHMLMSDETIPPATIEAMVSAGMVMVPTLSIFSGTGLTCATDNLRAFRAAGGRVIYGTDLGNEGPRPGIDPAEVEGMARAGMSGEDIVRSATVESAAWLRLATTGQITPGAVADLVLVDGDPRDDPSALTRIDAVWRRGRRVKG